MSGSEKKANENPYDSSSIERVTRKFDDVVVQNSGKEMYKKVRFLRDLPPTFEPVLQQIRLKGIFVVVKHNVL